MRMKKLDWKVFVVLGIIISVAVGFLYGTGILGGDSGSPGSKEDPLVTQGYADATINRRVQEMDDRINSLEAKVRSLENEIIILNGGTIDETPTGAGTTGSSTAGSGTSSGGTSSTGSGSSGSSSGGVSQTNIGKSATVTADVVNLRESASTSSNIKKKLTPSDTFTITKIDKDWYQVQLSDGTVGWVAGYLVKLK